MTEKHVVAIIDAPTGVCYSFEFLFPLPQLIYYPDAILDNGLVQSI